MAAREWSLAFETLSAWQAAGLYVLLAALVLWSAAWSMRGLDPIRKWSAIGLRLNVVLFCVLLLAGARADRTLNDLTVIALRDVSLSTSHLKLAAGSRPVAAMDQFLAAHEAKKPAADRTGRIRFGASALVDAVPSALPVHATPGATPDHLAAGTDVASAIHLGLAMLPADTLGRLVLFWDGNATGGDLDGALDAAVSRGVPIDVVPLRYRLDREIAVERVVAAPSRDERQPSTLEVVLRSRNPGEATAVLSVTDNDVRLDLDPATPGIQDRRTVTLRPGSNVERVLLPPGEPGAHRYRAMLETADPAQDTVRTNNAAEAVSLVRGRGRVLIVDRSRESQGESAALAAAFERSGLVVERTNSVAADLPSDITRLAAYDAVVLIDMPRGPSLDGVSAEQEASLVHYVRDLGGGLVVVGGPDALGAGGWIGSELEAILPVDCQPLAIRAMPVGALVLAVDCSGSMSGEMPGAAGISKQRVANESAILALRALTRRDWVGVISFDHRATWTVPFRENRSAGDVEKALRALSPGGGTNIFEPLEEASLAFAHLPTSPRVAVRHVLLLTDGQSQPGDIDKTIARLQAAGATLSTIGVGVDADTALLSRLADLGGGRFYFVSDPTRLTQVFIKEALTLRRALIREEPIAVRRVETDSPALAGIAAAPSVGGMILTWPKTAPAVQIALVAADTQDPLLAHWPVGLGRTAVFTSDAGSRWTPNWPAGTTYDKFWTQLVRSVARPTLSNRADARIMPTADGRAKIVVEALADEGGSFANFLNVRAGILSPDADAPAQPLRLRQSGPGVYEAEFDAARHGAYLASVLIDERTGAAARQTWLPAVFFADRLAETRSLESSEAAIAQVAARTRGRVIETTDRTTDLFSRINIDPKKASRPITDLLLIATIGTLLADVAVRRIAWDRHSLVGLFAWAGAGQPSPQRSAESLAALRAVRERKRVVVDYESRGRTETILPPSESTPAESRAGSSPPSPAPKSSPTGSIAELMAAKKQAEKKFEK